MIEGQTRCDLQHVVNKVCILLLNKTTAGIGGFPPTHTHTTAAHREGWFICFLSRNGTDQNRLQNIPFR